MRENPIINSNNYPLEAGTTYGTDEDEFMMGVAAENYDTNEALSDPRYVQYVTAFWEKKNDKWTKTWYPMHACSEDDFAKFAPPENE